MSPAAFNLKTLTGSGLNIFKQGLLPFKKKAAILKARQIVSISIEDQDIKCSVIKSAISGGKEIEQLFRIEAEGGPTDDTVLKIKAALPSLDPIASEFIGVVPSYCAVTRNIEIPSLDPD